MTAAPSKPKGRYAYCPTCGRDVGLVSLGPLVGAFPGEKLARHASTPVKTHTKGHRRPICTGSGLQVSEVEIHEGPGSRSNH